MTTTWRMLPPSNFVGVLPTSLPTLTANGRTYTCAVGSAIDVPDYDARILAANGWTMFEMSGPTSARPTTGQGGLPLAVIDRGLRFLDTTLAIAIQWDGATWRNSAGAAV